ncbi:DUF6285 domain-containing protein [Spirillospora sp. NPDC049652]
MPSPHDVPGPAELVAAVREFLERDVLAGLEGRTRFHALVAINVLGIVERELDQGADHAERHRARLRDLGFPDDAALAAAIRDGDLDDRYAEVKEALTAMVRDKLAVAHPRYIED